MSNAKLTTEKRRGAKAKAKAALSLITLLNSEDEVAEKLVRGASTAQRKALMKEFIDYHTDCLMCDADVAGSSVDNLVRFIKNCGFFLDFNLSVSKLAEIASHFENIGDIDRAVSMAEESLDYAETTTNKALQRKAYSILAACYSKQFDFERSCLCYERALRLAIQVGDALYEFAVLSNVVTLFDAMGLTREARQLTEKILESCPREGDELELLHLQNSLNGFRFAATLKDYSGMERFHAYASRLMRRAPRIPEIWRAYFEANNTAYLIRKRKFAEAKRRIDKRAKEGSASQNIRATILILASSVECAIATLDGDWLQKLEVSLNEKLASCEAYPPDYELALRLLAQIHEYNYKEAGNQSDSTYSRRLQERIVSVRHRQFFSRLSHEVDLDSEAALKLVNPVYDIKALTPELPDPISIAHRLSTGAAHTSDEFFLDLEEGFLRCHLSPAERSLRTFDYCIAENWAVAAELGNEGDGAHCFIVGTLASKIAAALGFDAERCLIIELSCRLHDIGKLAIPASPVSTLSSTGWHNSIFMRDHASVGERLLKSSPDKVLSLASRVARSHHEWWNGCGFPDSLSEEAIPVEARICAVASEYSALVGGRGPGIKWSHLEAVKQITTMAGVQFDPAVVRAFLSIEGLEVNLSGFQHDLRKLGSNRLKIAKVQLDACVSLT